MSRIATGLLGIGLIGLVLGTLLWLVAEHTKEVRRENALADRGGVDRRM